MSTEPLLGPIWKLYQNRIRRNGTHTVIGATPGDCFALAFRVAAKEFLGLGETAFQRMLTLHRLAPVQVNETTWRLCTLTEK